MAPLEASKRLLCAVDVHDMQSSLATSRIGEVCPRLAQES